MVCADCGGETVRRSPSQRYCADCSGARDTARKQAWKQSNPTGHDPARAREVRSEVLAAGAETSTASRADLSAWPADELPDAHTVARVALPFDYAVSKNAVWRVGRGGHVYARQESNAYRDALILALRNSGPWFQGKLWLDIFVEKPDHKGDAVNVVDVVCDAVKVATGVDDRWYSIARLDWSIVKVQPRLIVGLRQAVTEDRQVCSACGIDHPLDGDFFHRNRSTKTGFTRVCRSCSSARTRAAA